MWRIKDIPSSLVIRDNVWDVRFVKSIEGAKKATGMADNDNKEILIVKGLGRYETIKTLIHEILHTFEFEYRLKIDHGLVYKLEEPILGFFCDNWNYFPDRHEP
jgi:hypothetical protein